MLIKNELARMAVTALDNVGIEAAITDLADVDNNTPFVAAVLTSGLVASGMKGLILDGSDLSSVDLEILVRASRGIHSGDSWIRGDLGNHIRETQFAGGDIPKNEMARLAKQMGCSTGRLQNNMTTSSIWSLETRYDSDVLSYTHHEMLNAFEEDVRTEWAERAISEGMSGVVLRKTLQEESISIEVVEDEVGNQVTQAVVKVADQVDEKQCIEKLYDWYMAEVAKTPTQKVAFENVMQTFVSSGLVVLPVGKWRAALAVAKAEGNA